MELINEGIAIGDNPLMDVKDLIEQALRDNLKRDTRGEILFSSHWPQ